jgi:lysylphosphatidylglycerol synthetase-like protein (DUF2156 family)
VKSEHAQKMRRAVTKGQSILVSIVALVTLVSGCVNIASVIGPNLPERAKILQNIVSFQFQHFARFLTLLLGFALIVASINIYKRKRRAFWFVLGLACVSIVSQLIKGLDYEGTIPSLVLLGLLLVTRKRFTVKSSIPNLSRGVLRFAIALGVAFVYGVAGFLFLDRNDFGVQLSTTSVVFHSELDNGVISESLRQTVESYGIILSPNATVGVEKAGAQWQIADEGRGYAVRAEKGSLNFYAFGIHFTIKTAVREMLSFFTLQGDSQLVPRTRYARWFLNSLYLISVVAIIYALFALFRPVIYQFRTHPHERERTKTLISKYGRSSLDFFKYWPDKSYLFSSSGNSVIAYGVAGSYAVVLGDPVGPEQDIESVIREFITFCDENDWEIAFHQALPDFLPVYEKLGFQALKIGDQAVIELTQFTLQGSDKKEFRSAINKLERAGVHVVQYDPPIPDELLAQLKAVSDEWLQFPGRRERQFNLGIFEPNYIRSTPIFAAADQNGQILAFFNIIPSYREGEATIDLMRRRTNSPNGVIDYLFVKLFLDCKAKGFQRFSLGLAPMSGFQENEEASPEEKAIHYLFQHLDFIFSFTGLRQYKAKFATSWEPRYVVYRNVFDLPGYARAIEKLSETQSRRARFFAEVKADFLQSLRDDLRWFRAKS